MAKGLSKKLQDETLQDFGIIYFWNYARKPIYNGKIERYNRTIQEDFIDPNLELLFEDIHRFNYKLTDWLLYYNTKRPHFSHRDTNNLQIPPLRTYINMLNLDTEKSNMLLTQTETWQIHFIVIILMIKFNFIVSLPRKDVIDVLERVVTRIGISPFSDQQHLGVYRSFLVSVFIAKHFNGKTFLRIDDTNPRHQANIDALIDDLTQIIEPSLLDCPRNSEAGIYCVGSNSIPAIFESQRFELYRKY